MANLQFLLGFNVFLLIHYKLFDLFFLSGFQRYLFTYLFHFQIVWTEYKGIKHCCFARTRVADGQNDVLIPKI